MVLVDMDRQCIIPVDQIITKSPINLDLSIIKNCKDPKVLVTLKDSSNEIITEKSISFETSNETDVPINKSIFIVLGILIIFGFIVYFINLRKKENE